MSLCCPFKPLSAVRKFASEYPNAEAKSSRFPYGICYTCSSYSGSVAMFFAMALSRSMSWIQNQLSSTRSMSRENRGKAISPAGSKM
ncbi:hypothetical protein VTK26DRAFT_427 [Humicola hyalothermophila]